MEARPVFIEPLIVSTIQPRLPYYSREEEQITDLSAVSNTGSTDAIRSIHSVMGTNFSLSVADLHIQGGSSGDHQVLLDGTPVYNPVSLGRLTGAFSPYALKKITVHKAGFGVEAGSQLSGIIDISQDLAVASDPSLTLQADPLNLNARANVASELPGGAELKTMVAARGNIWQWYRKPSLQSTLQQWDRLDPLLIENLLENSSVASNFRALSHHSDINFYDLHLRSQLKHNELHTTELSLYQGKNYLQTKLLSHNDNQESNVPDFMYTQDGYDWLNTVGSLRHDWLISPRLNASFRASFSRHRSVHHFAMANSDQLTSSPESIEEAGRELENLVISQAHTGDRNKLSETTFKTQFDYSLHRHHALSFGLETSFTNYSFSLSDPFYYSTAIDNRLLLIDGFIEDNISLGYYTKLVAGSRFTFAPESQSFFAEPRLSFQFDRPQTGIGYLAGKISGGLYRQFINQFDLTSVGPSAIVPSNRFWLPSDFSTAIPKAYHFASELLVEPSEHTTLRWEGYYKWQPTTLNLDYHALLNNPQSASDQYSSQQDFVTSGKSYSYGSGLSISRFIESWEMEAMISYQISTGQTADSKSL
ncbi:MAG: Plug domain-containing protein [Balneolaceae bacterium]|nr:Plug domain-containing protein [Balneolaceae bacterium]